MQEVRLLEACHWGGREIQARFRLLDCPLVGCLLLKQTSLEGLAKLPSYNEIQGKDLLETNLENLRDYLRMSKLLASR